jgi:succinate dehydrogenase / fumarate reductase, iron-sulfur subunit
MRTVRFRIRRQADRAAPPRWEEFDVSLEPQLNVIAALMQIQRRPMTAAGQATTPVAWDSNCLEEICGACTVLVDGRVRQACSTLVEKLVGAGSGPVTLEPMSKFPVVRDLIVDRSRMFQSLKRVRAWIPLDGSYDLGPGPRYSQRDWSTRYALSRCFTCGSCLEVCPNVNARSPFIGAAPISQVRLMNTHPSGKMHATERVAAIMGEGGVFDCGNAQNCVRACPKEIPLTTSLADMMRAATKQMIVGWFKK